MVDQGTPIDTISSAAEAFESLLSGDPPAEEQDETPSESAEQAQDDPEPEGEPEEEGETEPSEDEEQPEEDEDQNEETPQAFTVKVNGEEKQVPVEELVRGYQRHADYTQKTQALADERRQFEQESQSVKQQRGQLEQLIQDVTARITELTPPPVDWERLRATDPIEFASQWAQHQMRQQEMAQYQQAAEYLAGQKAEEQAAAQREAVSQEAEKLIEAIPEWKDPGKARAEKQKLRDYGRSLGFTDQEIASVLDHRVVVLLRNAQKYEDMMKQKPVAKARIESAPVLKPGTTSRPKVTELTRMKQRLAKTGRVEDAASVFEQFL